MVDLAIDSVPGTIVLAHVGHQHSVGIQLRHLGVGLPTRSNRVDLECGTLRRPVGVEVASLNGTNRTVQGIVITPGDKEGAVTESCNGRLDLLIGRVGNDDLTAHFVGRGIKLLSVDVIKIFNPVAVLVHLASPCDDKAAIARRSDVHFDLVVLRGGVDPKTATDGVEVGIKQLAIDTACPAVVAIIPDDDPIAVVQLLGIDPVLLVTQHGIIQQLGIALSFA